MKKFFLTVFLGSIALTLSAQIVISPKGGGGSSSITGGTCTNQVVTALNTLGVPTCTTITSAYTSGFSGCGYSQQVITTSSQSTVDFTSIPAGYIGLRVVFQIRTVAADTSVSLMRMKINNDTTASDYSQTGRAGVESQTSTGSNDSTNLGPNVLGAGVGTATDDSNTSGNTSIGIIDIIGYTSTTWNKRIQSVSLSESTATQQSTFIYNANWKSTAAITSLSFALRNVGDTASVNFKDNSMMYLCAY